MQIEQFYKNGMTVVESLLPPPMGPLGAHIICWVGTAPNKHADVPFNVPFRVANSTDAAKLDITGEEDGWLWTAVKQTFLKVQATQYVIVVEEGSDDAETLANIIGGIDPTTEQPKGISAIPLCTESPTLIAAPGYTHQAACSDELVSMALRISAFPWLDGLSTTNKGIIDHSLTFAVKDTGYDIATFADPMPSVYSKAAAGYVYIPPSILAVGAHASVALHESPGNQGTYANGVMRDVPYDISDATTAGNLLNKHGICYFGKTSMGGLTLIGNRTLSGRFINQVCLMQAIVRKLKKTSQAGMSKNMSLSFIEQEIAKLNAWGANLQANEEVIGMEVLLHSDLNTADTFRNGELYVAIRFAGFPPLEHLVFHLNEDMEIIETFVDTILG